MAADQSMGREWCPGWPVAIDSELPPGTIRIEAAERHLVRLRPDGTAEFVAGPHDGEIVDGSA